MKTRVLLTGYLTFVALSFAAAGERMVFSLRDFSKEELKSSGLEVRQPIAVHLKALGGGGSSGWTYKSDKMFAYGWIINADTRAVVWRMNLDNTSRSGDDREFDGTVSLETGSYEFYFTAYAFEYHTTFTHLSVNVDHRDKPLFNNGERSHKGFLSWFTDWWSDDMDKAWNKRSRAWGIDVFVDDGYSSAVNTFTPPKGIPNVVLKATGLGENELVRRAFSLSEPLSLRVYALGEGRSENDLVDYGWIVDKKDRSRVWEMEGRSLSPAGGSRKNVQFDGDVRLNKGEYVLYYITDGSHSAADWNDAPPYDPLNWGITIAAQNEKEKKSFRPIEYSEDQNVIVKLTKVGDNEYRTAGFTLKSESALRVYAFGERSNSRRLMADYGTIMDAKTRVKVWTMDVDRTLAAGGASKNRYVDEVITLPKGSYIVTYVTDDSHAYGSWNQDPPFDQEHYGITVMGSGERFNSSQVSQYVEQRNKNIIAQIVRVGDDVDKTERFSLDRTTKVRVYSIGEGQNREMYDYGWIEDTRTGNTVWEMTYGMTFHAGGGRKNRMVNTTILLEKGDYKLRWKSDDSHSYGDWNVDPPEDQQYWGITLYREEGLDLPPVQPRTPEPPEE